MANRGRNLGITSSAASEQLPGIVYSHTQSDVVLSGFPLVYSFQTGTPEWTNLEFSGGQAGRRSSSYLSHLESSSSSGGNCREGKGSPLALFSIFLEWRRLSQEFPGYSGNSQATRCVAGILRVLSGANGVKRLPDFGSVRCAHHTQATATLGYSKARIR